MTITLYQTTSPHNAVTKTLTNARAVTGQFHGDVDVTAPAVDIKDWTESGHNYAHIPDLNRYYYISGISRDAGGKTTLRLTVDVLMSFRSDILAAQCIAARSASNFNRYISDAQLPTSAKRQILNKKFSDGEINSGTIYSGSPCVVLTVTNAAQTGGN